MDVPRRRRPRWRTWIGLTVVAVGTIAVAAAGFPSVDAGAPAVATRQIRTAAVQRGELMRSVGGPGTLVAEHTRWLTAVTAARVESIEVAPGTDVAADTIVLRLHNADMELAALEAESELAASRAQLANLRAGLETDRLGQQAAVASVRSEHRDAARTAEANAALADVVARDELERSRDRAEELTERLTIEKRRLGVLARARQAQVAAQQARVDQLQAVVDFRRRQIDQLAIPAGDTGVLQEVPVELGQWVTPGTVLAKVVRPDRLEAELRVPEVRARDVRPGQRAVVDTHHGEIVGEVSRIEPSVTGGTVTVVVTPTSPLPEGARPDQSVDGEIEIERLDDVVWVQRPAHVEPDTTAGLFRLDGRGAAERVTVEFGRASVDAIEVRSGLEPGDEIVTSDATLWQDHARIRIE